jgi:glycerol-3-phosphate O-acyltransferase
VFANAWSLAANRDLLQPGAADLSQRRRDFADELSKAVSRVAAIEHFDLARRRAEPEEVAA